MAEDPYDDYSRWLRWAYEQTHGRGSWDGEAQAGEGGQAGLEAMTEPLSHEDELEGKIETGELDWLNDELDETFVELTDLKEEAGLQEVLVLEKMAEPGEQASLEPSIAPTPEVGPELHPFGPEPPLAEIIDPVMKLEPDIEEAEEEGEPN